MPDQTKKTMHCFVSGRVQGVFFRARTKEQAQLFGLSGWVRNLPDGRVEVVATGDDQQLKQLREWLKHGPEMARVTALKVDVIELQVFASFSIR